MLSYLSVVCNKWVCTGLLIVINNINRVVGSLFLLMSISCSISLRMYQYIVIRRITGQP